MFELVGLFVGGFVALAVLALVCKLLWAIFALVLLPLKLLFVGLLGIFAAGLVIVVLPTVAALGLPLLLIAGPLLILSAPVLLVVLLVKAFC